MKKTIHFGLAAALSVMILEGGQITKAEEPQEMDTMYQVETLQSLMLGNYDGFVSVKEIKTKGNIGLGTFDGVDGEMIVLDGIVYQAKGDGSIVEAKEEVTSPFCSVTWFEADQSLEMKDIYSVEDLKDKLTTAIQENPNIMYAVKIQGTFDAVTVRSELAQEKPYKDLNTVMKTDQRIFPELKESKGTVVAVYFPEYMDGLNTPGWHFHYISEDHQSGGHVMDLSFEEASVQIDATTGFEMKLPDNKTFAELPLATEMDDAIEKVEGGQETKQEEESGLSNKSVLYIGLSDKDTKKQEISMVDGKKKVDQICEQYIDGWTVHEAEGTWKYEDGALGHEDTLVYTIMDASDEQISQIIQDVKKTLNQESVLWEKHPVNSEFR